MTNDPGTFERWMGPVRILIQDGGITPVTPPRHGEPEPFMWAFDPDDVVSMDLDGRPVIAVTKLVEHDIAQIVVEFKDGGQSIIERPIPEEGEGPCRRMTVPPKH